MKFRQMIACFCKDRTVSVWYTDNSKRQNDRKPFIVTVIENLRNSDRRVNKKIFQKQHKNQFALTESLYCLSRLNDKYMGTSLKRDNEQKKRNV